MKVYRLLIYEGPEEWIAATMNRCYVKGKVEPGTGKSITEKFVDTNPDGGFMQGGYTVMDLLVGPPAGVIR